MFIYTPQLTFYVYAYLREDGTPYYIGKGKGNRAWHKNHTIPIPKDKSKIAFLETNLTELGAFALERRYITWYGRKDNNTGILRNLTNGGEGFSGFVISDETRQKISLSNMNRTVSEETRKKISKSNIGKTRTIETKENIRKSKSGKNHPNWNKKLNETTKEKLKKIANSRPKISCICCKKILNGTSCLIQHHRANH